MSGRGAELQRYLRQGVAVAAFAGLFVLGTIVVEGFTSSFNLKSMLVLASFLGVAAIGQTLCALVGGLDLSIPFVIGAANILFVWLIGKGLDAGLAILVILCCGAAVGIANGVISRIVSAHSLIVTLGTGFAVVGAAQIVTSSGSQFAGSVYATPPEWLVKMTSLSGSFLGTGLPAVVFVWLAIAAAVLVLLRLTRFGRGLYALGDNPVAARLALVDERLTWIAAFALSGLTSSGAGILLVGFSGGGVVSVGEPYLFTTVAAVIIGGTSLLGGRGGYGLTMLGVAILTVLQTILVGVGLDPSGQQAALGAVIVAMVAIYAREPHPRMQV